MIYKDALPNRYFAVVSVVVFALAFLTGCRKSAVAPPKTVGNGITLIHNTADIPSACKLAFAKSAREARFEMANPGEKYQVSDVIREEGLPWRRLMFSAVKDKRCAVAYEKGGLGRLTYAVVFDTSTDPATVVWGGSRIQMNDITGVSEKLEAPPQKVPHAAPEPTSIP
jgi:hypothetical protein